VHEYRHSETGQIVAGKRISKDIDNPTTQLMFFRELVILVSIRHPAIVPIVGYSLPTGPEPGAFYIMTEFMKNGNVQVWEDCENQGRVSPSFNATCKSKIIFGLAVAMAHVHSCRVVHRDLKSENIFLDERWEPRLADFGLSKVVDRELLMSGVMGTPYFMAPELFDSSSGPPSFPIDVYAFAVIVLSLFTSGTFRFPNGSITGIVQLAAQINQGVRFVIPSTVKPCYRCLIEACWVHNPEDRPSFEDIVKWVRGDEFFIDETDVAAFREYKDRLTAFAPWRPPDDGDADGLPTQPFQWP
jgi:serine/threonine protein kinase